MNAFLAYKLWTALSPKKDMGINLTTGNRIFRYQVIQVVRQCALALILTFWVALLLGLVPAEFYFVAVLVPGWLLAAVVTPFVIRIVYPRLHKWGLLWMDIMEPEEVSSGRFRKVGFALTAIGALAGAAAVAIALYATDASSSSALVRFLPVPFLVLIFAGSVMMGGREQVVAMAEETRAKPKPGSTAA